MKVWKKFILFYKRLWQAMPEFFIVIQDIISVHKCIHSLIDVFY